MAIKVGGTTVVDDSRNITAVSISGLTTPLTVAQGGIGAATLTLNNVLLGNGASSPLTVAPGTSGNVLTSNGTTWTSAAGAAGGGSGLFNTSISSAASVAAATTEANVYAAASTAGLRYIIHSIHVTNIDGAASADVTAQIKGTTYSSSTLANTIPVPGGTSVELLKKPKVLQPSDYITINASSNSTIHATATIEAVTGTTLFGGGIDLTSAGAYSDLHTATANSVIESLLVTNDDGISDVKVRAVYTDGSNNIQGYYAYDLTVPADASVEILEQPKFLQNGYKVRIYANQANRVEAIIAGKVIV
jgi:hypothetical protein